MVISFWKTLISLCVQKCLWAPEKLSGRTSSASQRWEGKTAEIANSMDWFKFFFQETIAEGLVQA